MISQLIHHILLASICSTFFISIFVLFRKILIKYTGARWNYYLWFIIFIPWFVVWLPLNFIPNIDINFQPLKKSLDIGQQIQYVSFVSSFSVTNIIFITWLIGTAFCAVYILFKHFQFIALLKKKSSLLTSNQKNIVNNLLSSVNLISLERICLSSIILSPIICHIIKSKIYLPHNFFQDYTSTEQKYILQHECVHYQRCDLIANTAMLIIICINWFNPIILFSYRYFRAAQELSCDSMLCQQFSSHEKKAYGYALLKSAIHPPSQNFVTTCKWNTGILLKERMAMLKHHHSNPIRNLLGLLVLLTTASVAIAAPHLNKWSRGLTISNASFKSLSFSIDNTCSENIGIINAMSIKTISRETINNVCQKNPSHCKTYVFQTDNCSGNPISMIVIDINQGVQTIAVYGPYNVGTGSNSFNLFFNGPWDQNQKRK